ncbi:hypothetical protein U1Q18_052823 [Sarracenia purpurea var. burkii]
MKVLQQHLSFDPNSQTAKKFSKSFSLFLMGFLFNNSLLSSMDGFSSIKRKNFVSMDLDALFSLKTMRIEWQLFRDAAQIWILKSTCSILIMKNGAQRSRIYSHLRASTLRYAHSPNPIC